MRALDPDAAGSRLARGGSDLPDTNVTYHDQPMLKRPRWGIEVITYLFLGGLMGGTGMLIGIAGRSKLAGDVALTQRARFVALALATACPPVLIKHLGRPERFLNMLRVVKLKSPMSLGVWGLVGFSGAAGLASAGELVRMGVLPRGLRFLVGPPGLMNVPLLVMGAFIAGYTGVLISATAIPLWGAGKRHIPAMCVCSGMAGACALNAAIAVAAPGDNAATVHRLEQLEALASIAEAAIILHFERASGHYGTPMFTGERGAKLRRWTLGIGIGLPLLINAPSLFARGKHHEGRANTLKTLLTSALTLAGGYVLRETLIEAGKGSADDPIAASRQPE